MQIVAAYVVLIARISRLIGYAEPAFTLGIRLWVGLVFIQSGWLKLTSFDNTLFLFREEYRVPLLPPDLAAVAGTGSELLFGGLVIAGIAGRLSAAGLFAVNVMAVVSYAHVLLAEGFEAALGQHYLWGFMLAVLVVHGPGAWSTDGLLAHWTRGRDGLRAALV
jgi:putative oxidoreductase